MPDDHLKLLQLADPAVVDDLPEDGPGDVLVLALGLKTQSWLAHTVSYGVQHLPE